jgi:phytoene desaturase
MIDAAGIEPDVLHMTTPADWAARGYPAGTPFGAAHTVAQTGPFRLPTLDRRVENLVRCGANVQPGIGVPMALVSGRLAAARVTGAATMAA